MKSDRRAFMTRCVAGMMSIPVAEAAGTLGASATEAVAVPVASDALTVADIASAEKIMRVSYSDTEREMLAKSLPSSIAVTTDRTLRPHPDDAMPALVFSASLPGRHDVEPLNPKLVIAEDAPPFPENDGDLLYAPIIHLSRWIRAKKISSERLTALCLARLRQLDPTLKAVITFMDASAMTDAKKADAEIARGIWRGWLHGIPYGAKDLLDTAGTRTTFGAEPFVDRVPSKDAVAVTRLRNAGAVLVAKMSLGALAYGDQWFGGRTRNPWNPAQGSSGSSAGSAAAVAAGCLPFAIGSETLGSIISPSMRCGTTGLRPTFGRVARTGAMALCWSLDKLGPITRCVEDTAVVLDVLNGADDGDPSSVTRAFRYDGTDDLEGKKIGIVRAWGSEQASMVKGIETLKNAGCEIVELEWPAWNWSHLVTILNAEAAAAFEDLTLTNRDDLLAWQAPEAWPNSFREARFISAVDLVAADRFRRRVMLETAARFSEVEAVLAPSMSPLLTITNFTGHPALVLRSSVRSERGRTESDAARRVPSGITVWGHLFDEGSLVRIGRELEAGYGVCTERPTID